MSPQKRTVPRRHYIAKDLSQERNRIKTLSVAGDDNFAFADLSQERNNNDTVLWVFRQRENINLHRPNLLLPIQNGRYF